MVSCEECWKDAGIRANFNNSKSKAEHYQDILKERERNPCSPQKQAGIYWDEKIQCDSRLTQTPDSPAE